MPKNHNLIVSLTNFLPQIVNESTNIRITQNFDSLRVMTFIFTKKKKNVNRQK